MSDMVNAINASLVDRALSNFSTAASNFRSYKNTKKFYDYQWQKNLDQWNLENQYNLPVNQVQRLRAAGINPALYYGSSPVSTTAASSPHISSNSPAFTPFPDKSLLGSLSQYIGLNQQQQQIAIGKAQIASLEAQTSREEATAKKALAEAAVAEKEAGIFDQRWYLESQSKGFHIQQAKKELERYDEIVDSKLGLNQAQQAVANATSILSMFGTLPLQKQLLKTEILRGANIVQDTKLKRAQTGATVSQDYYTSILANKLGYEIGNIIKQGRNIDADTLNKQLQSIIYGFESSYIEENGTTPQLDSIKRGQNLHFWQGIINTLINAGVTIYAPWNAVNIQKSFLPDDPKNQ